MLALLLAALAVSEGNTAVRNFAFASGESMPELRLHYRTRGTLRGNNAVLVLHGTTGSGAQFLGDSFAGALFGPGQLLDASRYFIVLPDGIGHGASSRPSDGLHARFPKYGYADMVEAQRRVLQELHVLHLRLIIGTSMGCMHAWIWLEAQPRFVDAALPLACLPAPIAGRNRMMRRMAVESIRGDPRLEGRRVCCRAEARSRGRAGDSLLHEQRAAAAAGGGADARRRRPPRRRVDAQATGRRRRQRLHLCVRSVAGLRPVGWTG